MLRRIDDVTTDPKDKLIRRSVSYLLPVTFCVLLLWSLAIPVFESPDEPHHWQYAAYVHENRRLPPYNAAFLEGNQAPLYYITVAPFARHSDLPSSEMRFDSLGNIKMSCPPRFYQNCLSDFGKYWPIRAVRIVTCLLSTLTVLFIYFAGVEASGNNYTGLLAAALAVLLPGFAFRGSTISNDAMVATTSALALYFIIRLVRRGFSTLDGFAAGAATGLALLSKTNAIALVVPLAAVVLTERIPWRVRFRRVWVLGITGIFIAPWVIRNLIVYGDLLAVKPMLTVLPSMIHEKALTSPFFYTIFPSWVSRSFVGVFGWMNVWLPASVYTIFFGIACIAVLGYIRAILTKRVQPRLTLALLLVVVINIALLIELNLFLTQPQGRFLFPSMAAIAVFCAIGLENLLRWRATTFFVFLGSCGALNAYALAFVEIPSYWTTSRSVKQFDVGVSDKLMEHGGTAGPIAQNHFGQTFVSHNNNLAKVQIEVATFGRRIPSGFVRIHLRERIGADHDIANTSIRADQVKDCSYVSLEFPPIAGSEGKLYYLVLDTAEIPADYALTVFLSKGDVYPDGNFMVNDVPRTVDTSFQAFYESSPSGGCANCVGHL